MASIRLDGAAVLQGSIVLPMNGAWTADLQVASDVPLTANAEATIELPGLDLAGRIIRADVFAQRLRVRMTGGFFNWSEPQTTKHYRDADADQVLSDVGVTTESPVGVPLLYWTRASGTTGSTVEAIARHVGHNWRVNPDGAVRLAAESPATVADPDAVEISRDPARGLVTLAVELATLLPGTQYRDDLVGDVVYTVGDEALRCRYYTQARASVWGSLDRLIRFIKRDTLFLGQHTAEVIAQAADGTLDLMPDSDALRAQGLQAVPIRHGLPGVEVEVPAGERVLLSFDGGDPTKPYASLWHEGQVTAVYIGGKEALALAKETKAHLDALQAAHDSHTHITTATVGAAPAPGVISPTAAPVGPLADISTKTLFTS